MPRVTWSHLLIVPVALVALTVASCFNEASDCPTCPGVNSAQIIVEVTSNGLVDSVHVRIDGGQQVTVRKGQTRAFGNLSAGAHDVTFTRWFFIDELLTFKTTTLRILMDRGESRRITFHADVLQVTWAPMPDADPALGIAGTFRSRSGWARA